MKKRTQITTLVALIFLSYQCIAAVGTQNLRCEMLVNPQGIGTTHPRLSWEITGDGRNIKQTAYQILVASTPEKLAANAGDLWDSHKVMSNHSIMVNYLGSPLLSRNVCYWKVKVYTNNGESTWSSPARWTVGLLNPSDWKAKWIGYDNGFPWDSVSKFSRLSARYYRKQFDASQSIKRATVYVVGLGHYELFLNGEHIGDQVLSTPPTDYTASVIYNTFDVTKNIKQGSNAIATTLGNGRFFTMRPKYKPLKIKEFGFPKMLLQLELEYANGTKQTIISDESWKFTADGPIRTNNEYDGEEYDATKELPGWNNVGFNDSKWLKPELVQAPGGKLVPQTNEPIRVVLAIKPVSIKPVKPGMYVMDMGQNMAGWLNMKVTGLKGQKVQLRYAETTQKDGELYVANLRDAKVTDVYTLKGGGTERWHPVFVYHGFRYVEIVDYPGVPTVNDFEGQVVNDDLETTGHFETSNDIVNKIYRNAVWGIQANYKGMPMDCPQRNERMPWLADHATGSYSESFVFDNQKLYAKWLDDIEQAQKPNGSIPDVAPAYWNYYSDNMTWPATYLQVADMLYHQYGDKDPIAKHYASMKKWLAYMRGFMKDYIEQKDKYGDWCVPPESPTLIHSKDTLRTTDGKLIATAYYYRLLSTMQSFAKLLNKPQDVQEFAALQGKIKAKFNQTYFDAATKQYANNSVTSNLLPLYFDMIPGGDKNAVFKNIEDKIAMNTGHISTGVIGTQWLMRGLTDHGRADIAWHMATNTDYPSWGYMVSKGATTFWELWNGDTADPAMNSQNHVMLLGDLLVWFYEDLAGIKSEASQPAFKQLVMKPEPVDGLDFVNAWYHSIHGMIKSNWKKEGRTFNWEISIPANSSAIINVPSANADGVTESGKKATLATGVKFLRRENGRSVYEIGSGNYSFKSTL